MEDAAKRHGRDIAVIPALLLCVRGGSSPPGGGASYSGLGINNHHSESDKILRHWPIKGCMTNG